MANDPDVNGNGAGGLTSTSSRSAAVELLSLAPRYEAEQHSTYLTRLNEVIEDPKNRNIALTGRYGAGKSSVLDEFARSQKSTLRLAISTLGPDDQSPAGNGEQANDGKDKKPVTADGSKLTNQIQKELVKQLVFSAKPSTLRHSRLRRRVTLPLWRAICEAAVLIAVLVGFALFLGWLPPVAGTSPDHPLVTRAAAWAGFAALLVLVLTVIRRVTHDRWVVSDVSAGGATLTLSERTPTYFDEYLDDIVHYFDSESINIVIFEDLDRFDDPHIFEALRELNTLLNNTDKRIKRGKPLRFVYAVRDSLFEQLGNDTASASDDAAIAEMVRANRTKFFDVVVPMVPFITHRNAQDLLQRLLTEASITGIDRSLVNLVARHATDMRLLHNIRNEYLVFAERLLESDTKAPGLKQSNLFALVAYKNFHLGDFEKIARRASDLDDLYNYRRELVRDTIQQQQQRKRTLIREGVRERSRTGLAERLALRLGTVADLIKVMHGYPNYSSFFMVGNKWFPSDSLSNYSFWAALAEVGDVRVGMGTSATQPGSALSTLNREALVSLVPEAFDAGRWESLDADALRSELESIEVTIAFLRGADFADLAKTSHPLTVAVPGSISSGTDVGVERTFAELVDLTMKSDLARDLVKRGYLDRNFALYAAQFYGTFTGVDVATFMVQSVQANTMEVDYDLSRDGAVANLLAEAEDDFTRTVSAYNKDVVNYLLRRNHPGAAHLIERFVTHHDEDASTFLTAYLTSGAEKEKLTAGLAGHGWAAVFDHLVTSGDVPDDQRTVLVSSALTGADRNAAQTYELNTEVGQFIADHYQQMAAFTQRQLPEVTQTVATLLRRASVVLPDLAPLDNRLRALVVENNRYKLTANNVRAALDITGEVTLDHVKSNQSVYDYCLAQPAAYLAAVEGDAHTDHTLSEPETLIQVLNDLAAKWNETQLADHLDHLLAAASPKAQLTSLRDAPPMAWTALARANLFRASLANMEDYRTRPDRVGTIDRHLGNLLKNAGTIYTEEPSDTVDADGNNYDRETAAVAILNATTISEPATRVHLVEALNVSEVTITRITPESSVLFALLLDHKLVIDDAASFEHFHGAGWGAIGPAITASPGVAEFLAPQLVSGLVADLLNDPSTRDKVGRQVVDNVEEYLPADDQAALLAVAQYADQHAMALSPGTVLRIAAAAEPGPADVVIRLLGAAVPPASVQQIVGVFTALGGEYGKVAVPGADFTVANDSLHQNLLSTLKIAGVISEFIKKRRQDLYTVKV